MRCELCSSNWKPVSTQCPCRWGWCKGCWQSNNQVTYTNELLKLWMEPKMVRDNLDFIHKAQKVKIQAYDVWDNLVNGKEFSEEKKEALENWTALKWTSTGGARKSDDPKFVSAWDNPSQEHSFPSSNPWVVCKYCWCLQHYCKKRPCPAFKWDNNE